MNNKYEVVIIGAGIGGLVCGCYLAKRGMKVLIVEKNSNPGGYCTSFKRRGFTFDSTVRGLVGCGKGGILDKILTDLDIKQRINIRRSLIFDKIVTPDFEIAIKNDYRETKHDLAKIFPKEKEAINKFFEALTTNNFLQLYSMLKGKNFKELIDSFFKDAKLKSFWNIMRLDTGLAPFRTSALAGISLCRGYMLDGGYYPDGGMQTIPDNLVEVFKESGGHVILSNQVEKIKLSDNRVAGILLEKNIYIEAQNVVANCDATYTFEKLIGCNNITRKFIKKIRGMTPSPSVFIVYLGLNKRIKGDVKNCCSLWYFPKYPKSDDYDVLFTNKLNMSLKYFICAFPSLHDRRLAAKNGESIYLYIGAPFKNDKFWNKNRNRIAEDIILRASRVFPGLADSIEVKETATPQTLYNYTFNRQGASRGWAAMNSHTEVDLMPNQTFIKGLFLASHWVTCPTGQGGVAMAAYSGRNTAKLIMKDKP